MMNRSAVAGWRVSAALLLLFAVAALAWLSPANASAHAFLERSAPEANAIVPTPPAEIRLRFTEPLEPRYSQAELFDIDGARIATAPSRIGDDPYELILPLPNALPRGTYTVQWRNVSTADGHPQAGYFPFTVGGQADVAVPSPPKLPEPNAASGALGTIGRWLALLGVAGALGALVTWRWVIQPVMAASGAEASRVGGRVRLLGLVSVSGAVLGSLVLLAAQALETGTLSGTVAETRVGQLLVARLVLLLAFGALLWRAGAWQPKRTGSTIGTLLVGGLALLAYSSVSHAAAQPAGRPAAVAVDWLHLAAASVWVGGLLTLLVGPILTRGPSSDERRKLYAGLIPRFSSLAIASVIILTLTGLYASWLQVGNPDGLRNTDYGQTLALKLALIVPLLLLGAVNQRLIGPAMLRRAGSRVLFARMLLAEAVLGVAVLLIAGILIGLPPAREVLEATAGHASASFNQNGYAVGLHITPGAVGANRYTVDVTPFDGSLAADAEVYLRVSRRDAIEGEREIRLARVPGTDRFEAQGSELSVVGTWQSEVIIRQPNTADWRARTTVQISRAVPEGEPPGPPPYFAGITAAVAVLLLGLAVVLIVSSRHALARRQGRPFAVEAGVVLAVIGGVVLLLSRGSSGTTAGSDENPVPRTAASVAIGRERYQALCVSCHGPDGRGDGPQAAGLIPPPADLHAAHVDDHSDRQVFLWIRDGIDGSAMPGFERELSEEQIWHLVNYIRGLRHPVAGSGP